MSLLSRNKTGLLGVGPLAVRQAAQQRRAGMLAAPRAPSPIAATGRPITLSNQWDGVGEGLAALGKGLFGDKEAMEKKKREVRAAGHPNDDAAETDGVGSAIPGHKSW